MSELHAPAKTSGATRKCVQITISWYVSLFMLPLLTSVHRLARFCQTVTANFYLRLISVRPLLEASKSSSQRAVCENPRWNEGWMRPWLRAFPVSHQPESNQTPFKRRPNLVETPEQKPEAKCLTSVLERGSPPSPQTLYLGWRPLRERLAY